MPEKKFYFIKLPQNLHPKEFEHVLEGVMWVEYSGDLIVEESKEGDIKIIIQVLTKKPLMISCEVPIDELSEEIKMQMMKNYYSTFPYKDTTLNKRINELLEKKEEILRDRDKLKWAKEIIREILDEWEKIRKQDITENKSFSKEMEANKINKLRDILNASEPLPPL